MAKEIERKFLLTYGASIPIPAVYSKFNIKQGYISGDKDKNVRVRLTTSKAILGIKFTTEAITDEFEYEIPKKDGKEIYRKCEFKLEKRRLSFKGPQKVHYDVDSYPNGLVVVEVEFNSIEHMEKWVKPHWIDEEVTGKAEYSNVVLAKENLIF